MSLLDRLLGDTPRDTLRARPRSGLFEDPDREQIGCTFKSPFRIYIHTTEIVSPDLPHYDLTIYRVPSDDCKMIVHDGVEINFDLAKDLEIADPCTYSVKN